MDLPIPPSVVYAGLAGTLLALIVATAQNQWRWRVFWLLALRLAIGWQFLFEGLHKLHSHHVGPTETSKPFSSEIYFREADGPFGDLVRKQSGVGDYDKTINERLIAKKIDAQPPYNNAKLLEAIPDAVNADWDGFVKRFSEQYKLTDAEKARLDGNESSEEAAEIADKTGPGDLTVYAKAKYARWLLSVDPRDAKQKYVTGEVPFTVKQRLDGIAQRRAYYDDLVRRKGYGLGQGEGLDIARVKTAKADLNTARTDLIKDADTFLADLKKTATDVILSRRFEAQAPGPLATVGESDAQAATLLPAPGAKAPASFEELPQAVKDVWTKYASTFQATYPLSEADAKKAAEVAGLANARLANWYAGRDEFSGAADAKATFPAKLEELRQALAGNDKEAKTIKRVAVLSALEQEYADLKSSLGAILPAGVTDGTVPAPPEAKKIDRLDKLTIWTLIAAGIGLMAGLFTRLSAVVAAGFLLLTYLTHPPFPWLPLPPNTEGNPVFINKNLIEMIALLAIASMPTGRWMGVDALLYRCCTKKPKAAI